MQTDENTFEMSPEDIAEQIFSHSPGELNSIDLGLEQETAEYAKEVGYENFILNILQIITLHGIKILFGHTDLLSLTEDQLFLIKRYTRSYGYDLKTKIENNTLYINFQKTFI